MNKYIYLIKNILIFLLSSVSTKLITFFLLPFYTIYLSTNEYGIVEMMNTTVQMLLPFLTLSIIEGVLRFGLERKKNKEEVFSIGLIIVFISIVILVAITPVINLLFDMTEYQTFFWGLYAVTALILLCSNFARAIDKMKLIGINSVLTTFILCISNIILIAGFGMGIKGYLFSLIFSNIIGIIIYFIFGKFYLFFRFRGIKKDTIKQMLIYCIPLIPNTFFWWANNSINRYFLTALVSVSAVGLFSVASKIPSILNIVISIFQQAWNVSAIQEYNSKDSRDFFVKIYRCYELVMIVTSCVLMLFTEVLSVILFRKEFFEANIFVPLLMIGFFYNALNSFYGSIYVASKKTKFLFTTTALGTIIGILSNFFFIKELGAIGAGIAVCLSNLSVYVMRVRDSKKILTLNENIKTSFISHLGVILIGIFMTTRPHGYYIFSIVIFIGVFLINLGTMKVLYKTFYSLVKGKVRKNWK